MIKKEYCILILLLGLQSLWSCSPEDATYFNNEEVDIATIATVILEPNQRQLIADGHAQLDLRPVMFDRKGVRILDSRVKEEWLEYTSDEDISLSRYFSTTETSLIGKTITIRVKIKGTDVESQLDSFRIIAPLEEKYTSDITIPVIFHIIQTKEDIEFYGGPYSDEKIALHLAKLNNLFAGTTSVNPVGVNTRIRFEMARYTPEGQKMLTPGIDRLTIQELNTADTVNGLADFLTAQDLLWPPEYYMNIWLISDRKNKVDNFANAISANCYPRYVYPGTPADSRPEGIAWQEMPSGTPFGPKNAGVIYKLQELDVISREFSDNSYLASAYNELAYYVGCYFGLFTTCTFSTGTPGIEVEIKTDYCDDTMNYWGTDFMDRTFNTSWYKWAQGCYFRSENIMDDPTGLHISVSKNQCERIRWVLENCPERAAWKNDFAFTGK